MTRTNRPAPCVTRTTLALAAALLLTTAACRVGGDPPPEAEPPETRTEAAPSPGELRASVPIEGYDEYDRELIEADRRDASWRSAADSDRQGRTNGPWLTDPVATAADGTHRDEEDATEATDATEESVGGEADAEPADTARDRPETDDDLAPVVRMRNTDAAPSSDPAPAAEETAASETWSDITPQAFQSFAPRFPVSTEDGGPTVLAVQQLLYRVGFSPGVVDGRWGKNTEKALYWLQDELGLEPTGTIDAALYERLQETAGSESPVTTYRVSAEDVAGPFPSIPEDVQEKAALECLCYTSAAEALAERFRTTPDLLARLNPDADLRDVAAGTEILVPNVEPLLAGEVDAASREGQRRPSDIAALVVSKEGFYLHALDDAGRILYHFPTTVGAGYDDASPSEELKVTAIAFQPTFHYQPELFADVSDDDATAMLPAGPNSPVGVVWMQLSKEHYGIHGTAEPATIGYTTSHGCIRLTNWDALFLAERLPEGVPVMFRGDHPDDADGPADAGVGE